MASEGWEGAVPVVEDTAGRHNTCMHATVLHHYYVMSTCQRAIPSSYTIIVVAWLVGMKPLKEFLLWLHIIRFSLVNSKEASKERKFSF